MVSGWIFISCVQIKGVNIFGKFSNPLLFPPHFLQIKRALRKERGQSRQSCMYRLEVNPSGVVHHANFLRTSLTGRQRKQTLRLNIRFRLLRSKWLNLTVRPFAPGASSYPTEKILIFALKKNIIDIANNRKNKKLKLKGACSP
jgi:hypothetical protein